MLRKSSISLLSLIVAVASFSAAGRADELAATGRNLFTQYQHAVVTVQLVLKSKFSMGGMGERANESRQDVTGTVVDPSGLTVLALSATDPGQMMQSMLGGMSEEDMKFKLETELSDIKLLLHDGTEVPAEVVLRDKDLDLAFIRPKTKLAAPMTALDLSRSGKAEVLDQVVTLNRLGNAAGRAYCASVERISAIVQRPRLFYVPDSTMTTTSMGAPALTLDGNVLGVFVMRTTAARSGAGLFGAQPNNVTAIILPADAVLKAAKQAPPVSPDKAAEKSPDREKK